MEKKKADLEAGKRKVITCVPESARAMDVVLLREKTQCDALIADLVVARIVSETSRNMH